MNLVGIVNSILVNIETIAGINDPQMKITPTGFLQMLLENSPAIEVAEQRRGMKREIEVRYMQRGTESDVSETDDCVTNVVPAWRSSIIPSTRFAKIGIQLDDSLVRQLEADAANRVAAGTPPADVYNVLYQTIMLKINGLIQKINADLLTAQATAWGINAAYQNTDAQTIDFGGKMKLDNGIIRLISDAQKNEIAGQIQIVGNGVVNDFQIMNNLKSGVDSQGYGRASFNVYNDMRSASIWGANHFGVFAPGLTGFVGWDKYSGTFGGDKLTSLFFQLPLPLNARTDLPLMTFDAQLKYIDCPDPDAEVERGWALFISKNYALWNAPSDMFANSDRLKGFNGSLHYVAQEAPDCVTVCASEPEPEPEG
jgi:hypothetical protein